MNLFSNLFVSLFMATGSSFSAVEETFPLKEERVFDVKEKNSFTYVAASTGIYPSPSLVVGRRIKSLHHAHDVSIGLSCVPLIKSFVPLTSVGTFIQGYTHWGYYKDWGFEGAYHGPGIGVGVPFPLDGLTYKSEFFKVGLLATTLKPSYTIGKEYETYFSQLDLTVSVCPILIACGMPAIVPTITYEIGFKF